MNEELKILITAEIDKLKKQVNDAKKTIEKFTREKYKEYSGLAIQYLFHSKRNIK